MQNPIESVRDGEYLLPIERMTPDNISMLQQYSGDIQDVNTYMNAVRTAMYNYEKGYTSKIVLNPSEIESYIERIRSITVRIAGGYDADGSTVVEALAANILPDLLMILRENQLHLCQLKALYVESQGTLVGPLDKVQLEDTRGEGSVV